MKELRAFLIWRVSGVIFQNLEQGLKVVNNQKNNQIKLLFMKYEKLNQQMIRYHDHIKPRTMNPTFVSFNVGTSLGTEMMRSQSYTKMGTKSTFTENIIPSQQRNQGANQGSLAKSTLLTTDRRSQSNLLNYGMNSLGPIKKEINGRDIYEKQAKKYNIVTIQPKQYLDTINLFPKLRLQNSDENFYKKLVATNQLVGLKKDSPSKNIAFQSQFNKNLDLNPERAQSTTQIPIKPLRGKFLNNVDELKGIL